MGSNEVLDFERIPDELLIAATRIWDLRRASLIPYKQRKPGEPDIIVKEPGGKKEQITRHQLTENYTYCNGKAIKLGAWRENREVLVVNRSGQIKVYVVFIPNKYKVRINGSVPSYPKGYYIICKASLSGPDREHPSILDARFFRKMYRLDGNIDRQVIALRAKKASQNQVGWTKQVQANKNISTITNTEDSIFGLESTIKENQTQQVTERRVINIQKEPEQPRNKVDNLYARNVGAEEEKKFTAVGKHVTNGVIDGLFIKHKETGVVKFANYNIVKSAAKLHQIDNVGVREVNGEQYLFGIGMSIKDLPLFQ